MTDKIKMLMERNGVSTLTDQTATREELEEALIEIAASQADIEDALVELAEMIGG